MERVRGEAVQINTNYGVYMASQHETAYPTFRDITIRNVTCTGARSGLRIQGTMQRPIMNLSMEHVSIQARDGMEFEWVHGLSLREVTCDPSREEPVTLKNCDQVTRE